MEDPETKESLRVNVDRLAFMSPLLSDELALELSVYGDVPFRSISNPSLRELFGEAPVEELSMPSPTQYYPTI